MRARLRAVLDKFIKGLRRSDSLQCTYFNLSHDDHEVSNDIRNFVRLAMQMNKALFILSACPQRIEMALWGNQYFYQPRLTMHGFILSRCREKVATGKTYARACHDWPFTMECCTRVGSDARTSRAILCMASMEPFLKCPSTVRRLCNPVGEHAELPNG